MNVKLVSLTNYGQLKTILNWEAAELVMVPFHSTIYTLSTEPKMLLKINNITD